MVRGALEVSARLASAEELNLLVKVLEANKILWTNSVTSRDTEHESFTTTTKPAPDGALSRKKSPAAVPDFQFPHSFRANLNAQGNTRTWLNHGGKMARRSNQSIAAKVGAGILI